MKRGITHRRQVTNVGATRAPEPNTIRPFRARITVQLTFIDPAAESMTLVQAPWEFESAHATMMATLGSLGHAGADNPRVMAAARQYVQALPQLFEEVARDPARFVSWYAPEK